MRELRDGGEPFSWGTAYDALLSIRNGHVVREEIVGGDAAVLDPGKTWKCTGKSGVLRGGLGFFFIYKDILYGREDLLHESALAEGTRMAESVREDTEIPRGRCWDPADLTGLNP